MKLRIERTLILRRHVGDLLFGDLGLLLQVKLEIGSKFLSPVWPNLDIVG